MLSVQEAKFALMLETGAIRSDESSATDAQQQDTHAPAALSANSSGTEVSLARSCPVLTAACDPGSAVCLGALLQDGSNRYFPRFFLFELVILA